MRILFEISGEHPLLPYREIETLLTSLNISFKVREKSRVFVIDTPVDKKVLKNLASRLALSFCISELLYKTNKINNLFKNAHKIIIPQGTFRIRGKKIGSYKHAYNLMLLEKELGGLVAQDKKVDLENPNTEIRVLLSKKFYICRKLFDVDRGCFEQRRVIYRPFFSPISLHPRLARVLVNLSGVRKGEKLLDPFCGTGGILLEAGLVGIHVFGSDFDIKMVEGCKKTLHYYGIQPLEIFQADVGEIRKIGKVDAVVSDFPYGRSTRINRDLKNLYARAFENINTVLKKNKLAVIGLPSRDAVEIAKPYLETLHIYPVWVHKSLTRYFTVFRA
jgi:tRNA (guanine10-N2)-dimethyltransferase